MMKRYVGEPPSRPINDGEHRSILALLPEYVTMFILGQQLPPEWQALEQHLMHCAACRSEADALMTLVAESYTGVIPAVPMPSPPDLSFLDQSITSQSIGVRRMDEAGSLARIHSFQPIVIQFSALLLPRIRVQMAARTGGVHLRYAYEISPTDDASPTITVEVLVHDDQPTIGLVRVCVEHPGRSPFDQAGTHVTLQVEGMRWSGKTDQNGVTAFHDIPLDQMEQWQIRIAPQESNDADC
jgi:hypothetical protein